MSPHAFAFTLTVPNDPAAVAVITLVVAHAVEFAAIDPAKRDAFVERVRAAAGKALASRAHTHSPVQVVAGKGHLTVTVGDHAESEPLPS